MKREKATTYTNGFATVLCGVALLRESSKTLILQVQRET